MKKAGFSLGFIIVSNVLIIGISLVFGLHLFSWPPVSKTGLTNEMNDFSSLDFKQAQPR